MGLGLIIFTLATFTCVGMDVVAIECRLKTFVLGFELGFAIDAVLPQLKLLPGNDFCANGADSVTTPRSALLLGLDELVDTTLLLRTLSAVLICTRGRTCVGTLVNRRTLFTAFLSRNFRRKSNGFV